MEHFEWSTLKKFSQCQIQNEPLKIEHCKSTLFSNALILLWKSGIEE